MPDSRGCPDTGQGLMSLKLLLFIFITAFINFNLSVSHASQIQQVKNDVVHLVNQSWERVLDFNHSHPRTTGDILKLLAFDLHIVPQEIAKIEKDLLVHEYEEALTNVARVQNTSGAWLPKWQEIVELSTPVEIIYSYFKLFFDLSDAFIPGSHALEFDVLSLSDAILEPLLNFTDSTEKQNGTVTLYNILENITALAKGFKNDFVQLGHHLDEAMEQSHWCLWNSKTPQRIVYGLYLHLSLLIIKGFALTNFAHMVHFMLNGTHPEGVVNKTNSTLESRFKYMSSNAKKAIEKLSSAYWMCDPVNHTKHKTYEEFQELLQGYIENEKFMHHTGSCKENCDDFKKVRAYCPHGDNACHQQHLCAGFLYDCRFVAADSVVCPADPPRRYDYIQYKKGPTYGDTSGRCAKETARRDSFWRLIYHCTNCLCYCDDPESPTTVRHVSLIPVTSDVYANKVVTGVRFTMSNGVLHLQIQQGESTGGGLVLEESTNWKTLPVVIKKNHSHAAVLDYNLRTFDLDDLLVPAHHVVTGVRFRVLGNHINLEIQGTLINTTTGHLHNDSSIWVGNDNTPFGNPKEELEVPPREEVILIDPDIPTKTPHPSLPDSTHDQYVVFGPTSYVKDIAQTTVPFIDTQDVHPTPAVWLRGVGIYHKGQFGYGGFIAPRVFTRNVAEFIEAEKSVKRPSA